MDFELIAWILIFVGGYSLILGYLLRIALRGGDESGESPSGG